MFGSVNPELRYSNFDSVEIIHSNCPSSPDRFCYHEQVGTVGKECEFNKELPPCTLYSSSSIIHAANKLLNI